MNILIARFSALEIAFFVINYSNQHNIYISNLKLQKLLYFIQANYLVSNADSEPCFAEHIEAWSYGPVIPNVYRTFKKYGNSSIPALRSIVLFDREINAHRVFLNDEIMGKITETDFTLISRVIDHFSDTPAFEMVEITHAQDPWLKNYHSGYNNIISNDDIFRYFAD